MGATKAALAPVSSTAAAFFSGSTIAVSPGPSGLRRPMSSSPGVALALSASMLKPPNFAPSGLSRTNDLIGSGRLAKNAWASGTSFV